MTKGREPKASMSASGNPVLEAAVMEISLVAVSGVPQGKGYVFYADRARAVLKKLVDDWTTGPGPCGIPGHMSYWEGPTGHEDHCCCFSLPELMDGNYGTQKCNCGFENAGCSKCRSGQSFEAEVGASRALRPGETWTGMVRSACEGELGIRIPPLDPEKFKQGYMVRVTVECLGPRCKPFERACGDMPCGECGKSLYSHPQPIKEECPTMVEDCGGRWWKL